MKLLKNKLGQVQPPSFFENDLDVEASPEYMADLNERMGDYFDGLKKLKDELDAKDKAAQDKNSAK